MPLNFPSGPALNQTYTFGGKTWVWNGYAWDLQATGAINGIPIGNVTPSTGVFSSLSSTGNVTANGYVLGNGAFLTGVITSVANINNGTSNIRIETSGGNIFANVGGTANVLVLTPIGANVTGNLDVTGNISGNYILGNGAFLTGVITSVANINNGTSNLRIETSGGNIQANVGGTANVVTIANTGLYVNSNLEVTNNAIIEGNLTVNGNLVYVNVESLNVEDPIIGLGRGANNDPLTTDDGKDRGEQLWYYSGSEKSAFVGYDNSDGKLLAATNVTITNEVVTVNNLGNIVLGNIEASSVTSTGNISTTGNISGNYFLGNGSLLTGISTVNAFNAANVLGNVNLANANGRANLLASSNTTISFNAGNGIQIDPYTGNTTMVISVIGSLNDGTLWGGGGSAGNVTEAANIILDDGTVANAATSDYDLGNSLFPSSTYVIVDTTPPAIPRVGDTWIDTNSGIEYLYFNDGTSSQWVEMAYANITAVNTVWSSVTSNIIPAIDNTYTLGNTSYQWANAFVKGNITAGNIIGNGVISSSGNITAAGTLSAGVLSVSSFSTSGNVTGNYILGNGALLTGVITSVANINNGTSNVTVVSSGGNVTIGVANTANVAVFSSTGLDITGNIRQSNVSLSTRSTVMSMIYGG